MSNFQLPVFTKDKYSILEMIVQILRVNHGARLTAEQIDNFFSHPQIEARLNRKNAKDPISSIVWCYEQYHNKNGKFPELVFDGMYFYLEKNSHSTGMEQESTRKFKDQFLDEDKDQENKLRNSINSENTSISSGDMWLDEYLNGLGIKYTTKKIEDDPAHQEEMSSHRALRATKAMQMGVSLDTYIQNEKNLKEERDRLSYELECVIQAAFESANIKTSRELSCPYREYTVKVKYEYIKKLIPKDRIYIQIMLNDDILRTMSVTGKSARKSRNIRSVLSMIILNIGFLRQGKK